MVVDANVEIEDCAMCANTRSGAKMDGWMDRPTSERVGKDGRCTVWLFPCPDFITKGTFRGICCSPLRSLEGGQDRPDDETILVNLSLLGIVIYSHNGPMVNCTALYSVPSVVFPCGLVDGRVRPASLATFACVGDCGSSL